MTNNSNRLPSLPSVPRVHALYNCACGCGSTTQKLFTPGHDAKLKGIIMRVVRGVMSLDDVRTWADGFGRGEQTVKAVKAAMASKELMKRWNIVIPTEEKKVG